jgi:hypothetical protein
MTDDTLSPSRSDRVRLAAHNLVAALPDAALAEAWKRLLEIWKYHQPKEDPMAKKQAAPPTLSAEHKALAQQLGWDPSKLDWAKIAQLMQLLVAIIGGMSSPQQLAAAGATPKAGCEDHCCACTEAAGLALQSAQVSLDCAQGMCEATGD